MISPKAAMTGSDEGKQLGYRSGGFMGRKVLRIMPMESLFPKDEQVKPVPASGELEVPVEVGADFARLLDWYAPTVFVSWIILAVNVVVFVSMLLSGFDPDRATLSKLLGWGADYGPATIGRGEWWRMVTSMFVHLGFMHVLFNMLVLVQIGPFMERLLGNVGMLIVYLVSGIAGALCSLAWNPYIVSAGASGAIFGLYGALIGFLVLRRDSIPKAALANLMKGAVVFLIYNAVWGVLHSGTDLAAHIGGLLGGLACGLAVSNPITEGFARRRLVRAVAAGLVSTAVVLGFAIALPHPLDLQKEMLQVAELEKKTDAKFRTIFEESKAAHLSDRQVAQRVQNEILAPWSAERKTLLNFRGLKGRPGEIAGFVLAYVTAREQALMKLAEAFRAGNRELVTEALSDQQRAQENLKASLGNTARK
ncbi:MAG TPA: rhomboid family intramembrane serine protease [Bryobacteraceae bacterium]|jgi:rhomboid protease GluP|nr:rhomboid family intramembrane serine protease [Bryobacteraceae bacterium]